MKIKMYLSMVLLWLPIYAAQRIVYQPGLYALGSNVVYDPSIDNDRIICIDADDVIFDLGQHVITQKSTNTQQGLVAIEINNNRSNVIIKNGYIQNISGEGILIQEGCNNISIEALTITGCTQRGIACIGTTTNTISNIELSTIKIASNAIDNATNSVVCLEHGVNMRLNNCMFVNNGSPTHDLYCLELNDIAHSIFKNISICSNEAYDKLIGIHLKGVNNSTFSECIIQNNSALADGSSIIGFNFNSSFTSNDNVFEHCDFVHNINNSSNSFITGFKLALSAHDNVLSNCKVMNNTADAQAIGFCCEGNSKNIFFDCLARKNISSNDKAVGFCFDNCTGNKLIRCFAGEHNSVNSGGMGVDIIDSDECMFQDCTVLRNKGKDDANSFGFRENVGKNLGNLYIKNVAMKNGKELKNQYKGLAPNQQNSKSNEKVNAIPQPWTNVGFN